MTERERERQRARARARARAGEREREILDIVENRLRMKGYWDLGNLNLTTLNSNSEPIILQPEA